MTIRITSSWVHNEKGLELEGHLSDAILDCLSNMSRLAKPKQFKFTSLNIMRCEVVNSPVNLLVEFQIIGEIGSRITNAIYCSIKHSYAHYGYGERTINGKPANLKPELGGVTLEDIWQDNELWKQHSSSIEKGGY